MLINIAAALVCIADKVSAVKGGWRVSEKRLMLLCAMGGSVGFYIAMQLSRHKTRHLKFSLGVPAIIFVQVLIAFVILKNI